MVYLLLPLDTLAQDATTQNSGFSGVIVQLLLIFAIFYLLIIRPQQKKLKQHQETVNQLQKGDKVLIAGGISAVVKLAKEGDKFIEVEIAKDVAINVLRNNVTEVLERKEKKAAKLIGKKEQKLLEENKS